MYTLPLLYISIKTGACHVCQMWQMATVLLDSAAPDFAQGDFWFQEDLGLNTYSITYFQCDFE